jgi:peptide/nickel transport system substrate-binding protein
MRNRELDELRAGASELENHYIDEYLAGEISRRELFRLGTAVGMSVPLLGLFGDVGALAAPRPTVTKAGGTLRVGNLKPASAIDPVTSATQATLAATSITGEYLLYDDPRNNNLRPVLATSYKPDKTGKTWTFQIRKGVKFTDGSPMTAADVVATFERLVDPANASSALSAFKGVLSKGGTQKTGDYTVVFHLDAPNPSFPYLVSSTTYQAVILPSNYQIGSYEKSFVGTGPYKLSNYNPGVSAAFVRNPEWWGGKAGFDQVQMTFYPDSASQILALQGNQLDLIPQFGYQEGRALLKNKSFEIFITRSSAHRQLPMRVDTKPFNDRRVRVALALLLNRPDIIKTLFGGRADLGNDSPFAPVMRATNKSVPQRKQNIARAKHLLQQAGATHLNITLTTERAYEIPDLAVLLKNAFKPAGVNLNLNILSVAQYYAGKQAFVKGGTPWLNAALTCTDWAPRAVPNVLLSSDFKSNGIWNSAHYKNKHMDRLINEFTAALELPKQRALAGQMQRQLLADTPVIFPYFYNYLAAGKKNIRGYVADAVGLINLAGVSYA